MIAWFVLLAGCGAPAPVAGLPSGAAGPPIPEVMGLTVTDPLYPGGPFFAQVTGATSGATVTLWRSSGTLGEGDCPVDLGGACYGITPGATGYIALATLVANHAGTASMSVTLPSTLPVGTRVALQAVDVDADVGSAPVERVIQNPPLPCTDDGYENNDSVGASRLNPPNPLLGVTACPNDADWWGAAIPSGMVLTVTADFDHAAEGDLELEIVNRTTGALLDTSQSLGNPEMVTVFNGASADLRVGVHAWVYSSPLTGVSDWGGGGVPYELTFVIGPPKRCPVDVNEPDDDAATQAHPLAPGTSATFGACVSDGVDWFTLALRGGRTYEVTALHDSAEGDVDLYLFDGPRSNDPAVWDADALARAFTGLDNDTFVFTAPATATYWMVAHMYRDDGTGLIDGNTYALRVRAVP
ncbi:MAG TPA: PPC domain-containing protein [Myxococcota bacterium]|nr:PPC domain-containing protein [Myxococcota bacterium]